MSFYSNYPISKLSKLRSWVGYSGIGSGMGGIGLACLNYSNLSGVFDIGIGLLNAYAIAATFVVQNISEQIEVKQGVIDDARNVDHKELKAKVAQFAPRMLTEQQKAVLVAELTASFGGRPLTDVVAIFYVVSDDESKKFAQEISRIIGSVITGDKHEIAIAPVESGLHIFYQPGGRANAQTDAFKAAFRKAKVDFREDNIQPFGPSQPAISTCIMIGPKPTPAG